MDRRAFLTSAGAAALSIALPATTPTRPNYLRRVAQAWGAVDLSPVTVTKTQFYRFEEMARIFADVPGLRIEGPQFGVLDVLHLPGPGLLNEPVAIPRAPIPAGMTDWRQATPAEIIGDIKRALSMTDQSPAFLAYILPDAPATKGDN